MTSKPKHYGPPDNRPRGMPIWPHADMIDAPLVRREIDVAEFDMRDLHTLRCIERDLAIAAVLRSTGRMN